MKNIIFALAIISVHLQAATRNVCPVNCAYSDVQSAWNAASYGDTIVVASGNTYTGCLQLGGKPGYTKGASITITTDRTDWLPAQGTRVTLSDLPNMPNLICGGDQPISLYRTANGPVQGLNLIGLHIGCNDIFSTCGPMIWTNNWYLGQGHPATAADLPDGIVVDRCIIDQPLDDVTSTINAVQLETRAATIKNSWLYNWNNNFQEFHSIAAVDAAGPWTITNNMLVTGSTSILTGGAHPDIAGLNPSATVQYNFIYRPYKWWRTTTNPNTEWWQYAVAHNNIGGSGNGYGCFKNEVEFKKINGLLYQFNAHELMWGDAYCLGQSYSITVNAKTNTPCGYENCPGTGNAPTSNTFTWNTDLCAAGKSPCTLLPGWVFCLALSNVYNCQTIATVNNAARTGTITGTWPSTSLAGSPYLYATDPTATNSNMIFDSNTFRNIYGGPSIIGADSAYGPSNGGLLVNFAYTNNLSYQSIPLAGDPLFPSIINQTIKYIPGVTGFATSIPGGQNINISHNTWQFYSPPSYNWEVDQSQTPVLGQITGQPVGHNVNVSDNLMPTALQPMLNNGSCSSQVGPCLAFYFFKDLRWTNNTMPGASFADCATGQVCSGNSTDIYNPSFLPGSYKLSSNSPYSNAGSDGADLGADPSTVPLINNLRVMPASQSALLEFDLSAPIADAGDTQPCVLEVSKTLFNGFPALASYLSTYNTTNDLNPVFFKQATASNRNNPLLLPVVVNAGHVSWPIGQNALIRGDDGDLHDLRLTAFTDYWGRLMCYGDTRHFSFKTRFATTRPSSFPMQFTAPSGVATVQVNYGATQSLTSSISGPVGPGGITTLSIPVSGEDPLYTRVSYLDRDNNVVYTGETRVHMP